jgi:DNA-binding protein
LAGFRQKPRQKEGEAERIFGIGGVSPETATKRREAERTFGIQQNNIFRYFESNGMGGIRIMTELSQAAVERIIKKAGAERVSADAIETLAGLLEEHGTFLAREAKKMSDHAGRKTLRGADIRMAAEMFK